MNDLLDGKSCGHEFTTKARVAQELCIACLQEHLRTTVRALRVAYQEIETLADERDDARARAKQAEDHLYETNVTMARTIEDLFGTKAGYAAVTSSDGRFESAPKDPPSGAW